MGWGQTKFPIFLQLNWLTNANNIDTTHEFFVEAYGSDGSGYTVGDLCYDWDPKKTPNPPWPTPPPWNQADASDWKDHCQKDLNVPNGGLDHNGLTTNQTVKDDLTSWIREAILAKEQIIYNFLQRNQNVWQADRWKTGPKKWRIRVTGPGF